MSTWMWISCRPFARCRARGSSSRLCRHVRRRRETDRRARQRRTRSRARGYECQLETRDRTSALVADRQSRHAGRGRMVPEARDASFAHTLANRQGRRPPAAASRLPFVARYRPEALAFRRSAQYRFMRSDTALRWAADIAGRPARFRAFVAPALSDAGGRPRRPRRPRPLPLLPAALPPKSSGNSARIASSSSLICSSLATAPRRVRRRSCSSFRFATRSSDRRRPSSSPPH
jgi:hypothetical protein